MTKFGYSKEKGNRHSGLDPESCFLDFLAKLSLQKRVKSKN